MSGQIARHMPVTTLQPQSTSEAADAKAASIAALPDEKSFGPSISSVSNQDKKSIRKRDRLTLSLAHMVKVMGKTIIAALKLAPGPDAAVAIKDATKVEETYEKMIKQLKVQHDVIFEQLKNDGYSKSELEKINPYFKAAVETAAAIPPDVLVKILYHKPQDNEPESVSLTTTREFSSETHFHIQKFEEMRKSVSNQQSSRVAGISNAVGTTIGVAWAATAAASKATSFLAGSAANTSTAIAGSVLNVVAAGILIPLQLFLLGRNIANINTSRQDMKHISADSTALNTFKGASRQSGDVHNNIDKSLSAAQELLERRRTYSKYQVAGSIVSTVGDATTLGSGILTLTGVGAIVGIPVTIVGFVASLTGNIVRAVTQGKVDRFTGKAASESALRKMARNASRTDAGNGAKTIQDDASLMNSYQMRVAESKLLSIVYQVAKDAGKGKIKTEDGVLTEEAFLQEVGRRGDRLINHLSTRTGLLESDLREMESLLKAEYLTKLFPADTRAKTADAGDQQKKAIDLGKVYKNLHVRLQSNMQDMELEPSAETVKNINQAMTDKLFLRRLGNDDIKEAFLDKEGRKKAVLTEGDIKKLCDKYPDLQAIYEKVASQYETQQIRVDSKAMRFEATKSFITSAKSTVTLGKNTGS